jgi:hypothetical protein
MKGRITMNAENTKERSGRGRFIKGCCICLCCLIIGFLLGVALDAKYHPNRIDLLIAPDSKVALAPHKGDIINWTAGADPEHTQVQINFPVDPIPCLEVEGGTTGATCIFDPVDNGPSMYLYGCTLSESPGSCYDPTVAIGPRCPGCPPLPPSPPPLPINRFLNILKWDFERLFELSPGRRMVHHNLSGSTGVAGAKGLEAQSHEEKLPSPASTSPPARVIDVVAACNGGVAAVFGPNGPVANNTIPAETGDTITWLPYASYTITFADANACTPSTLTDSTTQSCAIKSPSGTLPYSLKMPSCTTTPTVTEYVQLPNATAATNPAGK